MSNYHIMFSTPPLGIYEYSGDMNSLLRSVKGLVYKSNNDTNFVTEQKYIHQLKPFREFKKFALTSINEYAKDVILTKSKINIQTCWANKAKCGEFHTRHYHANSLISGVFFVQADDSSPPITFESPTNNTWSILPRTTEELETSYNHFLSASYSFKPISGTLLLFHSSITHSVGVNHSQVERISISFNTFPEMPFGSLDNLTYVS